MKTQADELFELVDYEARNNRLKQIADPEMFEYGLSRRMKMKCRLANDPKGRRQKAQLNKILKVK